MTRNLGELTVANRWKSAITVDRGEWERMAADFRADGLDGWNIDDEILMPDTARIFLGSKPNIVVNDGVDIAMRRLFAVDGPPGAVITMGVDDSSTAPTAATADSTTDSTVRRLVAFDSTPTYTEGTRTMTTQGTFTEADVAFVMKRLFLSKAAVGTTDAAGDLYAMTQPFTIDLTSFSTWSQTFEATTTGSGS